jgi:hypothetical protein
MESHSLMRKLGQVVTLFVLLAAFSGLTIPQATAHLENDPVEIADPEITVETIIVIPNHATYEVEAAFIQGGNELLEARAPFGSGGTCRVQTVLNTFWPPNTTITIEKKFELPAGARNLRVLLSVDNDARVFLNGTDISGLIKHAECPIVDEFLIQAEDAVLREGLNALEVRATDRGVESYLDLRVLVDVPR